MGVSIIIYIDDILVLSESFEKYIRDAQFVIDRLIETENDKKSCQLAWARSGSEEI